MTSVLFPVSLDGAISQSQWRRPFSFPAALHLAAPSAAADGRETPGPRRFVRDDVIIQGDDGCCCDDSIASSTKRDASFNSPFVLLEQTRPSAADSFLILYWRRPTDCIWSRSCCFS